MKVLTINRKCDLIIILTTIFNFIICKSWTFLLLGMILTTKKKKTQLQFKYIPHIRFIFQFFDYEDKKLPVCRLFHVINTRKSRHCCSVALFHQFDSFDSSILLLCAINAMFGYTKAYFVILFYTKERISNKLTLFKF